MFVVLLTYTEPLDVIDGLMAEHCRFLEDGYRDGVFLACGRQVPRTGGVILAVNSTRDELEHRLATDPFVRDGAATFEIVEFLTSFHHPALKPFADPRTRTIRDVPG